MLDGKCAVCQKYIQDHEDNYGTWERPLCLTHKPVKPLLVGEANPYGGDPHFALYPAPDGCSGHRLCKLILKMRRADYLREFERRNLCPHNWNMREAREHAAELRTWRAPLILFGAKVARAFDFNPFEPFTLTNGGREWDKTLVLPHPSGLCRTWNEVGAFEKARELVAKVVPSIAHLLGVSDNDSDTDAG